ncbi:MAG: DNA-binding response regulator [Actinobacteria bacterium]|nr:DNA-binding response regulator [Actinomycetota bacterium]
MRNGGGNRVVMSTSLSAVEVAQRPGAVIDLRGQQQNEPGVLRVALVDAQAVFRRGVRSLLSEDPEISVVADADNIAALAPMVSSQAPQVILCDVALVDDSGELAATVLHEQFPNSHVVVVASIEDDVQLARAVRGGARGYLRRDCTLRELHDTVIAAARGESILAPSVATRLLDELATMVRRSEQGAEGVGALSKREREVLGLVAEGLNNRAIAARLFISENTVKNHVRNIHEKLGVHTRMEAVVRAVREGVLTIA